MSEKRLPINIVIGAVDDVTLKVMAINEKIKKATEPMRKLGSSLNLLGKESGAAHLAEGLGEVGKQTKELMHGVADFGLKATATIAAVSGIVVELGRSFGESGEHIANTSKELGMTTDRYQELSYAAKQSGLSQEEFDSTLKKLSKNIVDTASGTGESIAAFEALGIQVRDGSGHLKTLDQILPQIADGFSHIHNQNLKNAISMRLFGREGVQLNELLSKGSKGIQELSERAHAMGGIMSPEQIEEAEKVNSGFKDIGFTLQGIKNTVGAALAPALLELFTDLRQWLTDNRGEIQKFAVQFGKDLPGYVHEAVEIFKDLLAVMGPVVGAVQFLADVFGPVKVALAGLFFYLGGAGIVGQFLQLGMTITKVLGPALRFAWTLFSDLWPILTGIAEALAAIVGWPVLIGAAFVAAAALIWKYWGPISTFFDGLWEKFKGMTGFFGGATGSAGASATASSLPQMAAPLGALNAVSSTEAAPMNYGPAQSELKVSFENMPKGTRVETKKVDPLQDLMIGQSFAGTGVH